MVLLVFIIIAVGVVSYFICGIPFGLLIARVVSDVDVRRLGSGNVGTTNVARAVGKGAGALTLLFDAGKAALCCSGGLFIIAVGMADGNVAVLCPGKAMDWASAFLLFVVIAGHVFSPYLRFRGGKGIAVGLGALLVISWPIALTLLAIFAVVVLAFRRVSLGSIFAALALPVAARICYGSTAIFTAIACVSAGVIVWAHRSNIKKLFRGEERCFEFGRVHKTAGSTGQIHASSDQCGDVSPTTFDTDRRS